MPEFVDREGGGDVARKKKGSLKWQLEEPLNWSPKIPIFALDPVNFVFGFVPAVQIAFE